MEPKAAPKRRDYTKLGNYLRDARRRLYDETGKRFSVEDMAKYLGVTRGFVYQVEQGKRKPKNGVLVRWASVYGVRYVDLCKCLGVIPMDFVASYREEPEPTSKPILVDQFSQLTEEEKTELLPFLEFVRWKIANRTRSER